MATNTTIDEDLYKSHGLVSLGESERLLGISIDAIKRRVKEGDLTGVVQQKTLYITRRSLLDYLAQLPVYGTQRSTLASGMEALDVKARRARFATQPKDPPSAVLGDGGIVQPATPPPRRPLVLPNKHPVTPTETVDGEPVLPPALLPRRKPKGA